MLLDSTAPLLRHLLGEAFLHLGDQTHAFVHFPISCLLIYD